MTQKRKPGGQPGNQNAKKIQHMRKIYYPRRFFGMRWSYADGKVIQSLLMNKSLSERQIIMAVVWPLTGVN